MNRLLGSSFGVDDMPVTKVLSTSWTKNKGPNTRVRSISSFAVNLFEAISNFTIIKSMIVHVNYAILVIYDSGNRRSWSWTMGGADGCGRCGAWWREDRGAD